MSDMAVSDNFIIVSKGIYVDVLTGDRHTVFSIPLETKQIEGDHITSIAISSDNKCIALLTSLSKRLLVYDMTFSAPKCFTLTRAASKIRFTGDNSHILVADKTGDVLSCSIKDEKIYCTKLLGHLSLLLDVLHTDDKKFIITADRDEKIRVTHYPNTYNIQTYCLGHTEFVNHIELLSNDKKYLTSTSGDGRIKIWDYNEGQLHYNINTYEDLNDEELRKEFVQSMDQEAVEVNNLPIVHFTLTYSTACQSIVAATILSFNKILIYSINTENQGFSHKLEQIITLNKFPSAIQLNKRLLCVYYESNSCIEMYNCLNSDTILYTLTKNVPVFHDQAINNVSAVEYDKIKVLYKRKFDNVLEYKERKLQRLNQCNK